MPILKSSSFEIKHLARAYDLTQDEVRTVLDQLDRKWESEGIKKSALKDRKALDRLEDETREALSSFSAGITLRLSAALGYFVRVHDDDGEVRWHGTDKLHNTPQEQMDAEVARARKEEIEARKRQTRR